MMFSIQEHSKNMTKCIDCVHRKTDWFIDTIYNDGFLFSFPYISSLQLDIKWDPIEDIMNSMELKYNDNVIYVSKTKNKQSALIDINHIIMNMVQKHQIRLQKRK